MKKIFFAVLLCAVFSAHADNGNGDSASLPAAFPTPPDQGFSGEYCINGVCGFCFNMTNGTCPNSVQPAPASYRTAPETPCPPGFAFLYYQYFSNSPIPEAVCSMK
jgi:hypothetical protein